MEKQKIKYNLQRIIKLGIFLILSIFAFLFYTYFTQAQIPDFVNYQGRLKDSSGNPITIPTTIQFSLYSHITNGASTDVPSAAGPLLWTETYDGSGGCTQITPGADGIFAQHLGSCVPFPAYLDFTQEYYLGVKIGADAEATPRVPLSTHPYAFTSKRVHVEGGDLVISNTDTTGNILMSTAGGMSIAGSGAGFQGAVYGGDYEANFINRSLITKQYVDNHVGALTWQDTFNNELAITPNYIYAETPSVEFEDDGAMFMIQSKAGKDFSFGAVNALSFNFNGGMGTATIDDGRAVGSRRGIEYQADYSADYSNRSLVDKEYVDEQLMWEILAADGGGGGMRIQPKNNSVRQIFVQDDGNSYTQFKVRNDNDTGNGAGAIIELKGSGADYTNNMYIGKYGASFWIPELQNNGAVLTDKTLVVGTASASEEIHFVTGNSYTDLRPVVVADNEGFRYTSDLSGTFVDRTLVDKGYVDSAISSSSPTFQDVVDRSLAVNGYVYADTGAGEIEDDGAQLRVVSHVGSDFVFGAENMLTFSFDGGVNNAKILDQRVGVAQVGIEYGNDYSANYTNRSLVDKEYVDDIVTANTITVNNGLTKTGNNVQLGGGLESDTWITTAKNKELFIGRPGDTYLRISGGSFYTADVAAQTLAIYKSEGMIFLNDNTLEQASMLYSNDDSLEIEASNLGVFKGLVYVNDYSANYTNRSLVDKEYVDGLHTTLWDTDHDTGIQVEEGVDDDTIRFDTAGTEHFTMNHGRLNVLNTARSVFVGENAGLNDNLMGIHFNTAIGHGAMQFNTSGAFNTGVGGMSLFRTTTGHHNTAEGTGSLFANTTGTYNIGIGLNAGRYITGGVTDNTIGNYNLFLGVETKANADGDTNEIVIGYDTTGMGSNTSILGNTNITDAYINGQLHIDSNAVNNTGILTLENTAGDMQMFRVDATPESAITGSVGDLAYDSTNGEVYIKHSGNATNTGWSKFLRDGAIASIWDTDHDTGIQVEETADEDMIRFDTGGIEFFNMNNGRFSILNTGGSVFIGENAGTSDDLTNNANTFIGSYAGQKTTTGLGNTAIGRYTLTENLTGNRNLSLGYETLYSNTSGTQNVATGAWSLFSNVDGVDNVGVGVGSLYNNQSGSNNVAIGYNALRNTTVGQNIAIGTSAGDNITTGSNNIIIGHNIDAPVATTSNQLSIGNLIFGTGIDGTGTSISSGNIGIGTSTPASFKLEIAGDIGPITDDTYDLGSSTRRWQDLYLGPATLHIGSNGDESQMSYNTISDLLTFQNSADSITGFQFLDADGGNPILNIDTTNERIGIGNNSPSSILHIDSNNTNTNAILTLENTAGDMQMFRVDATPESAITGSVGDLAYDSTNGEAYIKHSGNATNTGWSKFLRDGAIASIWDTDHDTGIQVEETADEDMIRFDTGGNQRMLLKDSGLLTVDTETSDFGVAVFGTSHAKVTINQDDTDMAGINLVHIGDDDYPARVDFTKARGTVGNETSVQDGDEIGEITSIAYDGIKYITSGGLSIRVDGTPAIDNVPTKLVFLTTNSGAIGSSEKMTLNNLGNLGINTDTPTYKLTVVGDGSALTEGSLELATYADGGVPSGIYLHRARGTEDTPTALTDGTPMGGLMTGGYDGNSMVAYSAGVTMEATENWSSGNHGTQLNFLTTGNGSGMATTKMVLGNEGNLGVNIFNPEYTVTVGGAIMLDGTSIPTASQGFAGIYTNNGELYAFDENGNSTQISPHNDDDLWWYNSTNLKTGKTLQIDMELMTKELNKYLGGGYIIENGKEINKGKNILEQASEAIDDFEGLHNYTKSNFKIINESLIDLEKEFDKQKTLLNKIQETIDLLVDEVKDLWDKTRENGENIDDIEKENVELKKELCKKDASYSWCDNIDENKNDEKKDEEIKVVDEQEQENIIEKKNQNGNGINDGEIFDENKIVDKNKGNENNINVKIEEREID